MTPSDDDPFDDLVRSREAYEVLRSIHAREAEEAERAQRHHRRRRHLTGRGMAVLLSVLLLVGALAWARSTPDRVVVLAEARSVAVAVTGGPTLRPADSAVPLGTPPAAPRGGSTAFLLVGADGAPVSYDPCRPIEVVVNDRTMPSGAGDLVAEALAEMRQRTGLALELEGPTDERPNDRRPPYQPERYGERWAPVLIAWSDADELPDLDDEVIGFAGSSHLAVPGQPDTYVSGMVALDGPDIGRQIDDGRTDLALAVLLHELAHLLGLDHVDDPGELMFPEQQEDSVVFGPGDRRGLATLGAGRCVALR